MFFLINKLNIVFLHNINKEYLCKYNVELKSTDLYYFYHNYFDIGCDNVDNSIYSCDAINSDKSLDSFPREFYIKLERNLKLIPKLSAEPPEGKSKDENKLCFYLKYWFYDQSITKEIENTQITQLLSMLQQNIRDKCSECACELDVKSLYDINGLKQYYDYYLFLEAYGNTSRMSEEIYSKEYCKYIGDARISYLLNTTICSEKNSEYCNEFIKYIMPYVNIDEVSSISCQADDSLDDVMDYSLSSTMGYNSESYPVIPPSKETSQPKSIGQSSPSSEDTNGKTSTITSVSSVGIGFILFLLYKVKELLF
ncbi:VIR-like CYIR protein [Plasmodium cynomolgi strain B]|uniref:VIR-like CYIR protein n=1 Tax=Plasmodium cynomolgi (strain B) TaxID=1120755 RepID=K6UMK1_PLACD|nr:VIR-like CYIR protein [Plasmodium cynomolgi strain B]GAB68673.1 VIR-like CYIR protein [Plasmodium cynomolgi strain B]